MEPHYANWGMSTQMTLVLWNETRLWKGRCYWNTSFPHAARVLSSF